MATGGASPASSQDRTKSLECSLCLDIFTKPKLLPCHHCFCLKCLEGLASRHGGATFPCPQCRVTVTVPAGGMSKFQSNIYIDERDLDLAREGLQCAVHSDQKRDMFCSDCKLAVCLKCVLTKHRNHDTKDLSEAGAEAKEQLIADQQRLRQAVSRAREEVEVEERERQSLQDKRTAVEAMIDSKHAILASLVNTCRDELKTRVADVCRPLQDDVDNAVTARTSVLRDLRHLQQQVDDALTADSACSLLTVAREMREGRGSRQTLQDVVPAWRGAVTRPVLPSTITMDTLRDTLQAFLGDVRTEQLDLTPRDEVRVEEQCDCSRGQHVEVFSLCPVDDRNVLVTYSHRGLQKDAVVDVFTESGEYTGSYKKARGKATCKCAGDGEGFFTFNQTDSMFRTFTKSIMADKSYLTLDNNLQGQADIKRFTVTSTKPFKEEAVTVQTIKVGPHRAWDVDSSQRWMAVVEEASAGCHPRTVRMYGPQRPHPVTTYTPPPSAATFNPSDVIFWRLGGREVLLVADEGGDSVHVIHVHDEPVSLTFMRHLAPGCPLLLQPTALNADHRGRLWVACRGGRLITMTPLTS